MGSNPETPRKCYPLWDKTTGRDDQDFGNKLAWERPESTFPSPLSTGQLESGIIHYCLGRKLHRSGYLSDAANFYRTALERYRSLHAEDDVIVADILNDFGVTKVKQDQHSVALELFENALEICRKESGDNGTTTMAIILNNLGSALDDMCKPSAAIKMFSEALRIYATREDHMAEANTLRNIGLAFQRMGRFKEAEDTYWLAMRKFTSSVHVVDILPNIADTYAGRRNYDEAIRYYSICIKAKRRLDSNAAVADELGRIGHYYAAMGKLEEARQVCNSALVAYTGLVGCLNLDVANAFNNLGSVYMSSQQYDVAFKNFKKALGIALLFLGDDSATLVVADICHNIGLIYRSQGCYHHSISMFMEAICRYDHLFGDNHVKSAESVHVLGSTLGECGRREDAIKELKRAEKMYLMAYGEEYIAIADVLNDLGLMYLVDERFEDALEALQKGYNIYKKILGNGHLQTRKAHDEVRRTSQKVSTRSEKSKTGGRRRCRG